MNLPVHHPSLVLPAAALVLVSLMPATAVAGTTWEQWRGNDRDARVDGDSWPATLAPGGLAKRWSVPLAEGYPGPIVSENRVFTVESRDEEREVVRAFDRGTGEPVWESGWTGAMKVPFFARKNGSWVRSTPAFDGKRLYVGGMQDVLVCLDGADGSEVWRVDFKEREGTPEPAFGFASSPLLDGDALYVQAGMALAKLDKATGRTIWRTLEDRRAMYGSAFSSPVVATVAGKRQLVVQTREKLAGVDPADGSVLWEYVIKAFRGMNILTPTLVDGNRIFTSSYGGGSFLFRIDRADDGTFAASKVWTNKFEGYMSSPVVIDGRIYLHGRNQKFACLDAADGTTLWETKEKFGEYWSMVANGNRILALDESGELLLVAADPSSFRLVGRVRVAEEPSWAHVAVCGDEVFVRHLKGLTAFRWSEAPAAPAPAP